MQLGVARVDITPEPPVPLAGFASRASLGPATGVARPLHLRVLAFADARGHPAAVFAVADLLYWGPDVAADVRARVAARFAIPDQAVVLHATHTHSGPQVSRRFTPLLGAPHPPYLRRLGPAVVAAVDEAFGNAEPVTVRRGEAPCRLATNRRIARVGGPDAKAAVDPTVTVVRFDSSAGRVKGLLAHFACHPVVTHANTVSADFAGAAMDAVEQRLPPGAVAAYAQGCCGDLNPDRYVDGDFVDGDESDVHACGVRLADAVGAALGEAGPAATVAVETSRSVVELPVEPVPDEATLHDLRGRPGVVGEWAALLASDPERRWSTVSMELSLLRLSSDLVLLGMSAEPTSAYGRWVKERYAGRVLPLGYTNGMFGYLVTDAELDGGGYECVEAPLYFAMPGPLARGAEGVARAGIEAALAPVVR